MLALDSSLFNVEIIQFCWSNSLTRNSIYSIHYSYYSISLAIALFHFICGLWLFLTFEDRWIVFSGNLLFILWVSAFNWIDDTWMESFLAFTRTEQFSWTFGIKWLIISELMLFFAGFWSLINFRVISNAFSLFFSFPLLSSYSFAIPFSNLLILLFSSISIQAAQLFRSIGFLNNTIEGVGQTLCFGGLFIILQLKEFLYSYFSLSAGMIGSIFYFTTGLHGFHVIFGTFGFFLILSFYSTFYFYFIEFDYSLFFCGYYWHFVDWIWFLVFLGFFINCRSYWFFIIILILLALLLLDEMLFDQPMELSLF